MTSIMDLHTHSIASGHAYSTVQEMAAAAAAAGLRILGITEHGPRIPGAPDPIYFRNLYCVPDQIDGVRICMGAELNIVDYQGTIDLDETYYKRLSHVIAGLHGLCYTPGTRRQNTDAVLGAMANGRVNIISHPVDGTADLDVEELVKASRDTRTLLEVNNSSLNPRRGNRVARANNLELLRLCKRYDVPVILGSDAHMSFAVGRYDNLWPLLAESGFPDELIVNDDPGKFEEFTGISL